MAKIRVAIVGVGNCASSLIQGIEYYRDARGGNPIPGLMHLELGGYHLGDVEIVVMCRSNPKDIDITVQTLQEVDISPSEVTFFIFTSGSDLHHTMPPLSIQILVLNER